MTTVSLRAGAAVLGLAAVTVVLLQREPVLLVGFAASLAALAFALRFADAVPRLFLGVLALVLVSYVTLGRSFAYLGLPPVHIGEVMFAFALVAALMSGALAVVLRSPVALLLLLFAACGAFATVPYLGVYQVDALRDAALWGYGAFAVAVAACLLKTRSTVGVVNWYGRWIVLLVAWLPVGVLLAGWSADSAPLMPGTTMQLFTMKPGDAAVHLAGAAVFVLAGVHRVSVDGSPGRRFHTQLFWAIWTITFFLVASLNRGGFLAVAIALLVVGGLAPRLIGRRVIVGTAAVTLVVVAVLIASLFTGAEGRRDAGDEGRTFAPSQVVENVLSIVRRAEGVRGSLEDTRSWRLDWWQAITEYTLFGDLFWTGKGFGVNLASDDGFQVVGEDFAALRSPHNVTMTVLARMGAPGTLVWILLQGCFALSLARAYWRARLVGADHWGRINLWILGYWCAFLVNASFDVFIEGPQGGIPFWCLMGFGIAALQTQRSEVTRAGHPRVV
jgi:hypothetical protein